MIDMRLADWNWLDVVAVIGESRQDAWDHHLLVTTTSPPPSPAVNWCSSTTWSKPAERRRDSRGTDPHGGRAGCTAWKSMFGPTVRWEHIERVDLDMCEAQRVGDRPSPEHAPPHASAHPGQARPALADPLSPSSAGTEGAGQLGRETVMRQPARSSASAPRGCLQQPVGAPRRYSAL